MPPKRAAKRAATRAQASHSLFPCIDHAVILVPDLEKAIRSYTRLGFRVIRGGKHAGFPGQRTENALIPFEADGCYLELLAFIRESEPAPDAATKLSGNHRWWGLQPGLIDFALLPADIDAAIAGLAKLPSNPVRYAGPAPGARKTPAGKELQWKMGWPPSLAPGKSSGADSAHRPLPFLCFDVTPRPWRVPLEECEDAGGHTNGIVGLASVLVLAGVAEAADANDEQRGSYKGPSFEDVAKAYSGWCLPEGKPWQSVVEEEEMLAETESEEDLIAESSNSTSAHELIPQPENTVVLTRRTAMFQLQRDAPSPFHPHGQRIVVAEAASAAEVAHILANGSSPFEIELIADAGRMWGLESGSAGDEGELMDLDETMGARIRVRYVFGLTSNASRL
ncbi:glyoxalase-like domain-containing protein [Hyaloraphidium curvatum]|nr:glyoxalase-like domain-containing protein [Hyaloraphidium curvatum]